MIPVKDSRIDIINYITGLVSECKFKNENIRLYLSKDENVPWIHFYFLGDSFVSIIESIIIHSEENAHSIYGELDITELLDSSIVKKNIELFDVNMYIKNNNFIIKNITKKLGSININCGLIPMEKNKLEEIIYDNPHFVFDKEEDNKDKTEGYYSETVIDYKKTTDIFLLKILLNYSKGDKDLKYLYIVPSEKEKLAVLFSNLGFYKNIKEDEFTKVDIVNDIFKEGKNVVRFLEIFNFVKNIYLDKNKKFTIEQNILEYNEDKCNISNRFIIDGKDYLIIRTCKADYDRFLYKNNKNKGEVDNGDQGEKNNTRIIQE